MADCKGWLNKEGAYAFSSTRKRFFVLDDEALHYYKDEQEGDHIDSLPLEEVRFKSYPDSFKFELFGGCLKRTYILTADTRHEFGIWLRGFKEAIVCADPDVPAPKPSPYDSPTGTSSPSSKAKPAASSTANASPGRVDLSKPPSSSAAPPSVAASSPPPASSSSAAPSGAAIPRGTHDAPLVTVKPGSECELVDGVRPLSVTTIETSDPATGYRVIVEETLLPKPGGGTKKLTKKTTVRPAGAPAPPPGAADPPAAAAAAAPVRGGGAAAASASPDRAAGASGKGNGGGGGDGGGGSGASPSRAPAPAPGAMLEKVKKAPPAVDPRANVKLTAMKQKQNELKGMSREQAEAAVAGAERAAGGSSDDDAVGDAAAADIFNALARE